MQAAHPASALAVASPPPSIAFAFATRATNCTGAADPQGERLLPGFSQGAGAPGPNLANTVIHESLRFFTLSNHECSRDVQEVAEKSKERTQDKSENKPPSLGRRTIMLWEIDEKD